MCGRYTVSTAIEVLEQRFHAVRSREGFAPTYNAAPSQALPVICNTHPQEITVSAWGCVPEWADGRADVKPLINARAETVTTKPTFRQPFSLLTLYEVSPRINSPVYNIPEALHPVAHGQPPTRSR